MHEAAIQIIDYSWHSELVLQVELSSTAGENHTTAFNLVAASGFATIHATSNVLAGTSREQKLKILSLVGVDVIQLVYALKELIQINFCKFVTQEKLLTGS